MKEMLYEIVNTKTGETFENVRSREVRDIIGLPRNIQLCEVVRRKGQSYKDWYLNITGECEYNNNDFGIRKILPPFTRKTYDEWMELHRRYAKHEQCIEKKK